MYVAHDILFLYIYYYIVRSRISEPLRNKRLNNNNNNYSYKNYDKRDENIQNKTQNTHNCIFTRITSENSYF